MKASEAFAGMKEPTGMAKWTQDALGIFGKGRGLPSFVDFAISTPRPTGVSGGLAKGSESLA